MSIFSSIISLISLILNYIKRKENKRPIYDIKINGQILSWNCTKPGDIEFYGSKNGQVKNKPYTITSGNCFILDGDIKLKPLKTRIRKPFYLRHQYGELQELPKSIQDQIDNMIEEA